MLYLLTLLVVAQHLSVIISILISNYTHCAFVSLAMYCFFINYLLLSKFICVSFIFLELVYSLYKLNTSLKMTGHLYEVVL